MKPIVPEALEYLNTQRVCVLAVEMPDGSPHAATVHFALADDSTTFIIMTNPDYRKYQALAKGIARASLVVGVVEEEKKTFQVDGKVELTTNKTFQKSYYNKFPEAFQKFPKDVFFTFTPTWWRFTDWKTTEGKKIWISE
jgi:general stress protein 26